MDHRGYLDKVWLANFRLGAMSCKQEDGQVAHQVEANLMSIWKTCHGTLTSCLQKISGPNNLEKPSGWCAALVFLLSELNISVLLQKETVATSFRIGEEASRGGRGRGRGRGEGRFGGDRFGEGGGRFGGDRFGEGGGRFGGDRGDRYGEGGGRFGDREDGPRSYDREDRPARGGGGGRFGSAFGGVRGGRGRGDGPAPELTDDSAFPSLGGK